MPKQRKIKNNKVELLKALQDNVEEVLSINPDLESEVAEMVSEMRNGRKVRYLKNICRETKKWIEELEEDDKRSKEYTGF